MVTAAEAVPPCCLQMPSDLARRMSAKSLGLSLFKWSFGLPSMSCPLLAGCCIPLYCFLYGPSQDLAQSMPIYSSLSIFCSNLMKQSLLPLIRAAFARESPCGAKPGELSVLSCDLSACCRFWHCRRANPFCAPTCIEDPCCGEHHKEITWALSCFPGVLSSSERGFHSLPCALLL